MSEREEIFARHLSILEGTLKTIAKQQCQNLDYRPEDKSVPCDCSPCLARRAVNNENDWKYYGARAERTIYNPRERKVMNAWRKCLTDKLLCDILDENNYPSVRDWFVATTVVQWLVTNVGGSQILNEAGWEYKQYESDRKELSLKKK